LDATQRDRTPAGSAELYHRPPCASAGRTEVAVAKNPASRPPVRSRVSVIPPQCARPWIPARRGWERERESERELSQGRSRAGDGRERGLLRCRPPVIRLRPRRRLPPLVFRCAISSTRLFCFPPREPSLLARMMVLIVRAVLVQQRP
jgi:hypothetical protein